MLQKHLKVATFKGSFESNTFIYALIGTAFENPGHLFHKDKFYFLNSVCLVEGTNCITATAKHLRREMSNIYLPHDFCIEIFIFRHTEMLVLSPVVTQMSKFCFKKHLLNL